MRLLKFVAFAMGLSGSAALAEPTRIPAATQRLPGEDAPYKSQGPMKFRLIEAPKLCSNCDVIVAAGDIMPYSRQDFLSFLDWNTLSGKKAYFIVDSPGGEVTAAWAIGRKLRSMNASVIAG